MAATQKPLSFSLGPLNTKYILDLVAAQKIHNSRYNRSIYMDDLITHLRTKAKPKTELVVNDKKPVKRFVPPTFNEVDVYMIERGVNDNGEANKFCDFYESNGWKVGKNKMVNWKAAVRNWLKSKSGNNTRMYGKTDGNLSACEDFINGSI